MRGEGRKELHKKILVNLLISITVILSVIFIVPKLIGFFMPLIIAWIIASIANPMVAFLENRIKIMRKHGSVLVIVFVLLLIGTFFYLLLHLIVTQVSSMVMDLPGLYEQTIDKLQSSLVQLHQKFTFIREI